LPDFDSLSLWEEFYKSLKLKLDKIMTKFEGIAVFNKYEARIEDKKSP
jgi:hypothetical protein